MGVPEYHFSPRHLGRVLLKALNITKGKWALCLDYGIQVQQENVVFRAAGFKLVPFDPALHGHYIDADIEDKLSGLDEGPVKEARIKKGLCPNCGKAWETKPAKPDKRKGKKQSDDESRKGRGRPRV